jgi:hypothetical protein
MVVVCHLAVSEHHLSTFFLNFQNITYVLYYLPRGRSIRIFTSENLGLIAFGILLGMCYFTGR